ncbi:MAG: alkaline phosphatase family protein, partial [Pseudomonadota bacterium]|nr:alkaline phosphatase family protein [Pseudomonadota bacterium]
MKMLAAALALTAATQAPAQAPGQTPRKPSLIVAIAVDQFSSDLFTRYRSSFTGGLKRLSGGVAFARGYQSHAASETCPGHSTILTGAHPARSGIIANNWMNLSAAREDKRIYCAEDERVAGSNSRT